jgi:Zn-dependent protease with chaperone function
MNCLRREIRREEAGVLSRSILFILIYLALPVIGVGIIFLAYWIFYIVPKNGMLLVQDAPAIIRLAVLMGLFGVLMPILICAIICGLFLFIPITDFLKYIFNLVKSKFNKGVANNIDVKIEITEKECPELFSMIYDVAREVNVRMPKHVYLTVGPLASVQTGSPYSPILRDLNIGLAFLYGFNKSELKSVICHEMEHFAQKTGRVNVAINSLFPFMKHLSEMEERRQKSDLLIRARNKFSKYLGETVQPVKYIFKLLMTLFWNIKKRQNHLNWLIEYEADNVACRMAGTSAYISALCKIEFLAGRWSVFENAVKKLLSEGCSTEDFMDGYRYCYDIMAEDEGIKIDRNTTLHSPVGNEFVYNSRIRFTSGWTSHPAIMDRIEKANRVDTSVSEMNYEDACLFIPDEIINKLGVLYQRSVHSTLQTSNGWGQLKPIQLDELKKGLQDYFDTLYLPYYSTPFAGLPIQAFDIPSDEELEKVELLYPFTEENRNILLEYLQADRDWNTLMDIYNCPYHVDFSYQGDADIEILKAFELHKPYAESFLPRTKEIDMEIFRYQWKTSEDKARVKCIYSLLFYANSYIYVLQPIREEAENILSALNLYHENNINSDFQAETQIKLSENFRKLLSGLDLNYISSTFGHCQMNSNCTVDQIIEQWKAYLSSKRTSFFDTVRCIREVWYVLTMMFNTAKDEKVMLLKLTCKGKSDNC